MLLKHNITDLDINSKILLSDCETLTASICLLKNVRDKNIAVLSILKYFPADLCPFGSFPVMLALTIARALCICRQESHSIRRIKYFRATFEKQSAPYDGRWESERR